jgi:hypothetical protein
MAPLPMALRVIVRPAYQLLEPAPLSKSTNLMPVSLRA